MKTENILKRIAAALIALVLCVTISDTTSFAKAKAAISDTSLTMRTNETRGLSGNRQF